jgi:exodeoxyribonuclease VII small subunit
MSSAMTPGNLEQLSFEQAYAQLEAIVKRLENENLPLDDSLTLFEQGQALAAFCQKLLDVAELRVSQIMGDTGELGPLDE